MEVIFESDKIYFVKVSEIYINDYLNMINDPDVVKFISHNPDRRFTYEQEVEWVNEKLKNNNIVFSMIEKGTNKFIGNIEIMRIENSVGYLGISITKSMQNKHYGNEGIKAFINYILGHYNLENVALEVFSNNQRAIHCYENVGFEIIDGPSDEKEYKMIYNKQINK